MKKIKTKKQFGYIREISSGHIISHFDLPIGDHDVRDGFELVEVNSKADLDQISIYIDPAKIEELAAEQKIQAEIRAVAIDRLKSRGELAADFVDTKAGRS